MNTKRQRFKAGIVVSISCTHAFCGFACAQVWGRRNPDATVRISELVVTPGRAAYYKYLRADLIADATYIAARPEVIVDNGLQTQVIVSPDNRHCTIELSVDRSIVLNSDDAPSTISVKFARKGVSVEQSASTKLIVQRYSNGALSMGKEVLPINARQPFGISGTSLQNRLKITVARQSKVLLSSVVSATKGLDMNVGCDISASINPGLKRAKLTCITYRCSFGRLSAIRESNSDYVGFSYYPTDKQGQLRKGVTRLEFMFDVKTGQTHNRVPVNAEVIVAGDGSWRIIDMTKAKPDHSESSLETVKPAIGHWVEIR